LKATDSTGILGICVLAGLIFALLAGGCAGPTNTGEPMWTWRRPELLYLLSSPCHRLYVEVDTVQGVKPPADSLACLKEALREYCDKPGGIQIVHGRPIPLAQAKGKPPRILALLNIDGPPAYQADDRTAYLYVLFYDSRRLELDQAENPYVDRYYPCAIYLDVAYWPRITKHIRRRIITHELGHVLGLCKNTAHGDGLHCAEPDCLMSPQFLVPLETWLLGLAPPADLQASFCRQCLRDLQALRAQSPDPRLSFSGPMLVRRENGYSAGFLPGCTKLWFESNRKPDWKRLRAQLRPLVRRHDYLSFRETPFLYLRDAPRTLHGKTPLVARAAEDPNPLVAEVASGLLEQLRPDVFSEIPPRRAHVSP